MNNFISDLQYSLRLLRKDRAFTALSLVALALGIGANAAIFTLINAALLRGLPFADPERLVMVWERTPAGKPDNVVQPWNYNEWRTRNHVFDDIAILHPFPMNVAGDTEPEQLPGGQASANLFPILGVQALVGRTFTPEEDTPGGPKSAVLSYGLWQRRFGGDMAVIGRRIVINSVPHTIAGVMPRDFSIPGLRVELWTPFTFDTKLARRDGRNYMTIARLKRSISVDSAQAEMNGIAAQLAAEYPQMNARWGATVMPLKETTAGKVRFALFVLWGAVGLVLLIACANVGNLCLMRGSARLSEFATRIALGAPRYRLIRQLVVESSLLALGGGLLGLQLGVLGLKALVATLPANLPLPHAAELTVDSSVLAFTFLTSLVAGILFGAIPALHLSRVDPQEWLRRGGRGQSAGTGRGLRNALVIAEVAVAMLLVAGAGLMLRSFAALRNVDPGFQPEHLLTMRMILPWAKYSVVERRAEVINQILERARSLPQVRSAASIHLLPMTGQSGTWYFRADRPAPQPGHLPGGDVSVISSDYFRTMGIAVTRGRDFEMRDRLGSPAVAMLNEAAARMLFPGEDPIGKRLSVAWTGSPQPEIVGIARDIRHNGLARSAEPTLFLPNAQVPHLLASLLVRTAGDPLQLTASVKAAIRGVDPEQSVADVLSMEVVIADSIARPRMNAWLLGIFGAIALTLACVGVYGAISYSVQQRTGEIGLRMALGATPQRVVSLVLREALILGVAGVSLGLAAALALTRLLTTFLFAVTPTDPATLGAVALILMLAATCACLVPARRAMRLDPMAALRQE